jgi:hypothetical protein
MVDACMTCSKCKCKEEQYCATGSVFTYGGKTKYGRAGPDGVATAGGYSDKMVVNEHFGIKVPDGTPLEKAAPLLCAGYVHLICPNLSAINWGRGCMQRVQTICPLPNTQTPVAVQRSLCCVRVCDATACYLCTDKKSTRSPTLIVVCGHNLTKRTQQPAYVRNHTVAHHTCLCVCVHACTYLSMYVSMYIYNAL